MFHGFETDLQKASICIVLLTSIPEDLCGNIEDFFHLVVCRFIVQHWAAWWFRYPVRLKCGGAMITWSARNQREGRQAEFS